MTMFRRIRQSVIKKIVYCAHTILANLGTVHKNRCWLLTGAPHAGNNCKIGLDFIPPNVLESFLQSNAICGSAGIGRQARLRCVCLWRVGSSPIFRTKRKSVGTLVLALFCFLRTHFWIHIAFYKPKIYSKSPQNRLDSPAEGRYNKYRKGAATSG